MIRLKSDGTAPKPSRGWRLFRRRQCWVPTWRGWLVFITVGALAAFIAGNTIHSFLSVTAPIGSDFLAAEGWMNSDSAKDVVAEFHRGKYSSLYVTGGPLERGEPLSEYKTYAELGAAVLRTLSLPTNAVQAVPAPRVRKDRTFAAALALKEWLTAHGGVPRTLDVVSMDVHARRTRLLYARAFGDQTRIGIIALENPEYDARHWWRSSKGVRVVVDETVAYLSARFFFHPDSG